MLEQVVKPLSSGSILPWLTASRIVTTNSLSQLATPSSISSDQSVTLSGTATATVAGLITAQSGLTVSSNAAVSGTGTVTGLLTAQSGLSVSSNAAVSGTATVTGLLTASSALTVASTVTLSLQTASRILTTSSTSTVASPSAISTAQTLTLSTATGTTLTVSSTDAASVVLSGGLTIGSVITLPITTGEIRASASTSYIAIGGGSAAHVSQGAVIEIHGNSDGANPGQFLMFFGNVAGANWQVRNGSGSLRATIDNSSTAGDTAFSIWDVDNAALERVTVGAADSGGAGYKVLRIPN